MRKTTTSSTIFLVPTPKKPLVMVRPNYWFCPYTNCNVWSKNKHDLETHITFDHKDELSVS